MLKKKKKIKLVKGSLNNTIFKTHLIKFLSHQLTRDRSCMYRAKVIFQLFIFFVCLERYEERHPPDLSPQIQDWTPDL